MRSHCCSIQAHHSVHNMRRHDKHSHYRKYRRSPLPTVAEAPDNIALDPPTPRCGYERSPAGPVALALADVPSEIEQLFRPNMARAAQRIAPQLIAARITIRESIPITSTVTRGCAVANCISA